MICVAKYLCTYIAEPPATPSTSGANPTPSCIALTGTEKRNGEY